MREPTSVHAAAMLPTTPPAPSPRASASPPAKAHRACAATCCCAFDSTDPAPPTSSLNGSAPAGPASSSSSGRSRRPDLVSRQTVRHGVGRPRHLYDVTADAQDLFPSNYDGLAAGLLAAIEAVGGDDLLDQVFAARRRQLGDRVREQMAERCPPTRRSSIGFASSLSSRAIRAI